MGNGMNIKTYLKSYHLDLNGICYILLAIITGAIPAITILLRADLIDYAVAKATGGDGGPFFALLAMFCSIYLLDIVLQAVFLRLFERHNIRQTNRLDNMRINKAARTAFTVTESSRFHTLLNKAANAPEADEKLYRSIGDIVRSGTRIILSLATIFFVDIYTALGIIILLIIGIFLNGWLAGTTEGFWSKYIENMRRTNYFSSLLMQRKFAAERKIFSYDDEIERRYEEQFERAKKQNSKSGKRRLTVEIIMQLGFAIYSVAIVLLLLRPFIAQDITIGVFTSVFYAATGLLTVSGQLYAGVYTVTESARQLRGFFEFMALPEECADGIFAGGSVDAIQFDNVTFTYPDCNTPVLKGINLCIKSGRHYAVVGENGCGKTTLTKLLLGLYKPESGKVCINGQSVGELSLTERRKIFAVVFQDFYKYPLTMRENLSLCAPRPASDGQIAELFDSIDFHPAAADGEKGYDSDLRHLKSGGSELSGGEWQKLAVARCIMSSAPVVVLDEPNSALDPVAEAAVYNAYRKKLSGRTALFISHRLGSVRMADEIIVLKDGKILAVAPHDELMASCGYYAELYNTQKEMYDEKE